MISPDDWSAILLTAQLAAVTTIVLLVLGVPLAWWLAHTRIRGKALIEAIIALPLVLPSTVIGFYLLIAFAPSTAIGQSWQAITGTQLAFSFSALVMASTLYSLPFVVQPLQSGFQRLPHSLLEAAATLGATRRDRLKTVILPLCRRNFFCAAALGFAHTVGGFGLLLIVGGNGLDQNRVLSIAVFDHVQNLQYPSAHWLAGGLLLFSLFTLVLIYSSNREQGLGINFGVRA